MRKDYHRNRCGKGGMGHGLLGHGLGRRILGHGLLGRAGSDWQARFDTAAETLGLTPEQLFAELHAGKSVAEIAEEQGVELKALHEAEADAHVETAKQAIKQAVEDGHVSQEQADWALEGLKRGFFRHGRRFGFGHGHGHGHGRCGFSDESDREVPTAGAAE